MAVTYNKRGGEEFEFVQKKNDKDFDINIEAHRVLHKFNSPSVNSGFKLEELSRDKATQILKEYCPFGKLTIKEFDKYRDRVLKKICPYCVKYPRGHFSDEKRKHLFVTCYSKKCRGLNDSFRSYYYKASNRDVYLCQEILKAQKGVCPFCDKDMEAIDEKHNLYGSGLHLDHIIPLNFLYHFNYPNPIIHNMRNLQILHASCNIRKLDKIPRASETRYKWTTGTLQCILPFKHDEIVD